MRIFSTKNAGFCYGVANALNTVNEACKTKRLITYGLLIHNRDVTAALAAKGVRATENLDEITDETVVIRSHGVAPAVYDELNAKNISYIDCTCPHVKKIHRIARECQANKHELIILGDADHPEIIGIRGYAPTALVVKDLLELQTELQNVSPAADIKYELVVQTTYDCKHFMELSSYLRQTRPDIQIWNTICEATAKRQAEAEAMSKEMDVMIILGDPQSSNTEKLFQICSQNCERTVKVESIHNFLLNILKSDDKMGITAGASTPPGITEEAVHFMSELENKSGNQSFEEMLNDSLVTLHTGDVVKGTVIQVTPAEVSVNLGYKSDGIIPRAEITDDATLDICEMVKAGETIDVYVLKVNDGDGNVLLSKKRLDAQKNFTKLEDAFTNKTPVRGKIIDQTKGGLLALVNGVRVFVPSSQISNRYVEDLSVFKGKEFDFNILELDRTKRRVVAGRKELATLEQNRRKEEFFASAEVGQKMEGVVSRITAFGAFIDLGGIDGLIHISELSWGRVKKVSDVLKEGDRVLVSILDLNHEKGKISLSLKDVENDPWRHITEKYPIGAIVQGKVVRLVPFGAFVELEPGLDGLIHISQIAPRHVTKPENELTVDEVVSVKILGIDDENKKISLSKKEADGVLVIEDETQPGEIPAEFLESSDGEPENEAYSDAAEH